MADYREIAQEYAKGAIKTVVLINAGAILATLNQLPEIVKISAPYSFKIAMLAWVFGIASGVIAWVLGFKSAIEFSNFQVYEGKSEYISEGDKHIDISNSYTYYAVASLSTSLVLFVIGCLILVFSINSIVQ